ncbi:MAG: 16S rRNA processing protein RimM [Nevskiaceae bacterium]|nr:MAG: 16S rRNA processing protein RimM [Nevskiaceae bacterium]TBR71872.1 MAG: 16S rRNA processing protein RimM [Nevskiaceae bacterium]
MDAGARIGLGRVAGTFGVRGWLRVESWTRPIDNLLDYPDWDLDSSVARKARLLEGRVHGRGLVVRIALGEDETPLEDCDRAAELVGARIAVPRSMLPPLPAGSYYWTDLVGLQVVGQEGVALGRVESVMETGAQDVMVVVDSADRRLIPFVPGPIVEKVDLPGGVVTVNWAADY